MKVLDFFRRKSKLNDSQLKTWLLTKRGQLERRVLMLNYRAGYDTGTMAPEGPAHLMLESAELIERNPCSGPRELAWRITERGKRIAKEIEQILG